MRTVRPVALTAAAALCFVAACSPSSESDAPSQAAPADPAEQWMVAVVAGDPEEARGGPLAARSASALVRFDPESGESAIRRMPRDTDATKIALGATRISADRRALISNESGEITRDDLPPTLVIEDAMTGEQIGPVHRFPPRMAKGETRMVAFDQRDADLVHVLDFEDYVQAWRYDVSTETPTKGKGYVFEAGTTATVDVGTGELYVRREDEPNRNPRHLAPGMTRPSKDEVEALAAADITSQLVGVVGDELWTFDATTADGSTTLEVRHGPAGQDVTPDEWETVEIDLGAWKDPTITWALPPSA
ncbi:hypothetical protein [Mumia flava]|uniref:hypothetical protein n=1 Tax=Mumia flava TaxID=1348852 RepID=UPI0012FDEAA7|nr:hypothetical protein [Mumia flava]